MNDDLVSALPLVCFSKRISAICRNFIICLSCSEDIRYAGSERFGLVPTTISEGRIVRSRRS